MSGRPSLQPAAAAVSTTVSVTRVRLRSLRVLPLFMLHANRTIAQLRRADGFLAGRLQRDDGLVFWTLTLWRDALAMRAYGASGAHRKAAPHLLDWGSEADVVHWTQAGDQLPGWPEAVQRLREGGRALPLRHPAAIRDPSAFREPRARSDKWEPVIGRKRALSF